MLCPTSHTQPRMAMNVAQHKTVNLLKTGDFFVLFSLVFVYLMCDPSQLFFFQCGPETPRVGPPVKVLGEGTLEII